MEISQLKWYQHLQKGLPGAPDGPPFFDVGLWDHLKSAAAMLATVYPDGPTDAMRAAKATPASPSDVATHDATPATPQVTLARRRLGPERAGITRTFRLAYQHKDGSPDVMHIYFTAGVHEDGTLGEVFVRADKTGTLASGALDAAAIYMSMMLQYGVPLAEVLSKIRGSRFPPSGFTRDPEIPSCTSPLDLLARWLELKFIPPESLGEG